MTIAVDNVPEDAMPEEAVAFAVYTPGDLPHGNGQDVEPGSVDVWAYALDSNVPLAAWLALLPGHERDRSQRFLRERDRVAFAVAHGVLRAILALYVGGRPPDVDIRTEGHGKPVLGGVQAATGIAFSLAHSADLALVGVSKDRRIGVDLERVADTIDALAIAQRFFSPDERAAIAAQPASGQRRCFYRHWVAKEAVLKAHGGGMSVPLASFDVVITESPRAAVRSMEPDAPGTQWRVRFLANDGGGWHGAVAAAGDDWRVRVRTRAVAQGH